MAITVFGVVVFVLLAGLRMSALVGRDGAVHYTPFGIRWASSNRRRLGRKFGRTTQ